MIRPDDPWYPCEKDYDPTGKSFPGVTIRMKLAAEMMKSPLLPDLCEHDAKRPDQGNLIEGAFLLADDMIEQANREEVDDGK